MGTAADSDRSEKFSGVGWVLPTICRRVVQDGKSHNATHAKGQTFLMDRAL